MGKFKTIFAACLGLGVAAGAGYYLYRRFSSKDGRNEDASLTQVKKNRKVNRSLEKKMLVPSRSFLHPELKSSKIIGYLPINVFFFNRLFFFFFYGKLNH